MELRDFGCWCCPSSTRGKRGTLATGRRSFGTGNEGDFLQLANTFNYVPLSYNQNVKLPSQQELRCAMAAGVVPLEATKCSVFLKGFAHPACHSCQELGPDVAQENASTETVPVTELNTIKLDWHWLSVQRIMKRAAGQIRLLMISCLPLAMHRIIMMMIRLR